jgi:hypothetical protein
LLPTNPNRRKALPFLDRSPATTTLVSITIWGMVIGDSTRGVY